MSNGKKQKTITYRTALKSIKDTCLRIDSLLRKDTSERLMRSRDMNNEALQKLIEMEGGADKKIPLKS